MKEENIGLTVLTICLMILAMLMFGVSFHQQGKNKIRKEAVERGYATYDNDNGKSSTVQFKWNDELKK